MTNDGPIVAEVRKRRAAILARFGYDLRKYGEHLMAQQVKPSKHMASRTRRKRQEQRPARPGGHTATKV